MSVQTIAQVRRILDIHHTSQGIIRPHFFLTGPSGSGKTFNVEGLCDELMMPMYEINCAQLTKEGLSGNSLSKALAPIANSAMSPCVVFFDEFDKLFIRGNSNSDLADDSTTSIQNELLKILEGRTTSVYSGKYGQYEEITINHCLFIFGGAWNGEADIDLDRLRAFGVKTELLDNYLKIYADVDRAEVVGLVQDVVRENYELNTLGYRQIAALLHQYFINGSLKTEKKQPVFKKALTLPKDESLFGA